MLTILGWILAIGFAVLAFMFAGAGLGALIGKTIAVIRKPRRS